MAKRFTKPTINWVELEKRVPLQEKAKFIGFKAKATGYLQKVLANPAEAPKINWDEYKKAVTVPGLVDKFKAAYEKFKVPFPDDKLSVKIDEQWKSLEGEIAKFCEEMQKDIDAATKELNRVNSLPKFDDMTMEMYYDMYPKDALDPVNRPSFWPHNPEEQPGYMTAEQKALKASKDH